jgi:hypothetical protein
MTATLTFPNINLAQKFETEWTRFTLEGRDRSSEKDDGSFDVTVYNLNSDRKEWIENWIQNFS